MQDFCHLNRSCSFGPELKLQAFGIGVPECAGCGQAMSDEMQKSEPPPATGRGAFGIYLCNPLGPLIKDYLLMIPYGHITIGIQSIPVEIADLC